MTSPKPFPIVTEWDEALTQKDGKRLIVLLSRDRKHRLASRFADFLGEMSPFAESALLQDVASSPKAWRRVCDLMIDVVSALASVESAARACENWISIIAQAFPRLGTDERCHTTFHLAAMRLEVESSLHDTSAFSACRSKLQAYVRQIAMERVTGCEKGAALLLFADLAPVLEGYIEAIPLEGGEDSDLTERRILRERKYARQQTIEAITKALRNAADFMTLRESLLALLRNHGVMEIGDVTGPARAYDPSLHDVSKPLLPGEEVRIVECGWLIEGDPPLVITRAKVVPVRGDEKKQS